MDLGSFSPTMVVCVILLVVSLSVRPAAATAAAAPSLGEVHLDQGGTFQLELVSDDIFGGDSVVKFTAHGPMDFFMTGTPLAPIGQDMFTSEPSAKYVGPMAIYSNVFTGHIQLLEGQQKSVQVRLDSLYDLEPATTYKFKFQNKLLLPTEQTGDLSTSQFATVESNEVSFEYHEQNQDRKRERAAFRRRNLMSRKMKKRRKNGMKKKSGKSGMKKQSKKNGMKKKSVKSRMKKKSKKNGMMKKGRKMEENDEVQILERAYDRTTGDEVECGSLDFSEKERIHEAWDRSLELLGGTNHVLSNMTELYDNEEWRGWFELWFGPLQQDKYELFKDAYDVLYKYFDFNLENVPQNICPRPVDHLCRIGVVAFVFAGDPDAVIFACDELFTISFPEFYLIHEASHFESVQGTQDFCYGAFICQLFAQANPTFTHKSADTIAYAAVTNPENG